MTPTADIELVKGTPSESCSPLKALARGIQDVFQAEGEEEKRGEESGECFSRIDRYASQGQLGVLRDPVCIACMMRLETFTRPVSSSTPSGNDTSQLHPYADELLRGRRP